MSNRNLNINGVAHCPKPSLDEGSTLRTGLQPKKPIEEVINELGKCSSKFESLQVEINRKNKPVCSEPVHGYQQQRFRLEK